MFDSQDRKQYFNLSESVLKALAKLRTPTNKVCFLIAYAYFKAKKRFYTGNFRTQDIEYGCRLLGINIEWVEIQSYNRKTKLDHESIILKITGYSSFDSISMDELSRYIYGKVKSYSHPKSMLAHIMDYLSSRKIVLPRYRTFVNIISQQIKQYKREIHDCLKKCLDDQTKSYLDQLISHNKASEYTLSSLRRYNQSLRPGNIRENITDFNQINSLYSLIASPFHFLNFNHDGALYWTR